jgi:hypothetical protein
MGPIGLVMTWKGGVSFIWNIFGTNVMLDYADIPVVGFCDFEGILSMLNTSKVVENLFNKREILCNYSVMNINKICVLSGNERFRI